ncbi:hypothetical protein [Glycomyces harbinensis]|uniref:NlpC/P60 family protein n=1 Tax=Glycomyces harbinensis TaxID=58114 RepID=A0A1G7DPE9_9ACTN|nr:hypothetical protein [Glycomyces harbinensis]SDE53372.1 hypothetical protein SAMN05216270_12716 [Glycomyces harbinensis]
MLHSIVGRPVRRRRIGAGGTGGITGQTLTKEHFMTDTEQPNLSRRRMLTAALLVPAAAAGGSLVIADSADAAPGGQIKVKRSQVIKRAKYWYDRDVPYSQSRFYRDLEGSHKYRTDCSGFVSQCWHTYLGSNGGYSTSTIPSIAKKIKWSDLKAGDVMNRAGVHCMLFDSWSITSGMLWMYDLADPQDNMRHKKISANSLQSQNYVPRRYGNIVSG